MSLTLTDGLAIVLILAAAVCAFCWVASLITGDVVRYSFTYWDTAHNYAVDTAQQTYTMK